MTAIISGIVVACWLHLARVTLLSLGAVVTADLAPLVT
jgi:hypothetical protein